MTLDPVPPLNLSSLSKQSTSVESMETCIHKMAEFSMMLDPKQQEMLAAELQKLGADFH